MGVAGDALCMTWDNHSLTLTRIQFHPLKVSPLANLAEITVQGLCNCNSNAWKWHNSNGSGVISITEKLIILYGIKLCDVQEEQERPKTPPWSLLTQL